MTLLLENSICVGGNSLFAVKFCSFQLTICTEGIIAHVFDSVCHVLSPLCSRKLRLYQQINTGIDGHQIKTIRASSSNSSVKLISY